MFRPGGLYGQPSPPSGVEPAAHETADDALLQVGRALRAAGYKFTTITPLSHQRVNARTPASNPTLRDIFGWSRSFREDDLPEEILRNLQRAGAVEVTDGQLRSKVRFSALGEQLFAHSAFPTEHADAVFFGPDTYRFARAIASVTSALRRGPAMRVLDIGAGSGAGGLYAAQLLQDPSLRVVLTDINTSALRFSRVNALLNGVPNVEVVASDLYTNVSGIFDLIVSNPPYLVDRLARVYRHGGGEFGSELSMRIIEEGLPYLRRGRPLLLYTGTAVVDGADLFERALRDRLGSRKVRLSYDEIDPDVFGEELEAAPYDRVDRIAVVAAVVETID
jgi:methylase of polypeptide subunit release factors